MVVAQRFDSRLTAVLAHCGLAAMLPERVDSSTSYRDTSAVPDLGLVSNLGGACPTPATFLTEAHCGHIFLRISHNVTCSR